MAEATFAIVSGGHQVQFTIEDIDFTASQREIALDVGRTAVDAVYALNQSMSEGRGSVRVQNPYHPEASLSVSLDRIDFDDNREAVALRIGTPIVSALFAIHEHYESEEDN